MKLFILYKGGENLMSELVNMYTVVPIELAADLKEKKKVKDYNTLPQINPEILDEVREFMTDNVGFSDLPMACLSLSKKVARMDTTELFHYLPANNKDSVLFQLQMPNDMIVTVSFDELLRASKEADEAAGDEFELDIVKEEFRDSLSLGECCYSDSDDEMISFIPFLDYNYCKFYAKFDENFETGEFDIPGIEKISLARLSAFIN